MKKRRIVTSSSENKSESSWLQKRLKNLIGPFIVGIMAVVGQLYVSPIAAERVMIRESITQKRYEACEKAINVLQKELASTTWITGNIPEGYTPPEKKPTQLELNVAYTLLATYGKSGKVSEEFLRAFDYEKDKAGEWIRKPIPERNSPKAVGEFVVKLREEMDIEGTDIDPNTFGYIFGFRKQKKSK